MECAFDAGTVVVAEIADVVDDVLEVLLGDLGFGEHDFAARIAGSGKAAEIEDDFQEALATARFAHFIANEWGQGIEKQIKVVGDDLFEWEVAAFGLIHVICGITRSTAGTPSLRGLSRASRRVYTSLTPSGL